MSSKAGTINAAIITALEAITAGETYQNTVVSVNRIFKPPQNAEKADFPYINFRTIVYDESRLSNQKQVQAYLHLGLYVHVPEGTADSSLDDLIQSLVSDVKIALDGTAPLSSAVIDNTVEEVSIAEIKSDESGFISADVAFQFKFRHSASDPT